MNSGYKDDGGVSRRTVLTGSAAVLLGAGIGGARRALADVPGPTTGAAAPPLPWKWVKLDPLEAGRRAYRIYLDGGGCGTGAYLSLLSLLKEKVGHPWTTLPDMAMHHAAAGFAGHGTLCGSLAGASSIINLVTYSKKDEVAKQVKAMSPLCHTSVSKWTLAAGAEVTSKAKRRSSMACAATGRTTCGRRRRA